MTRNDFRVCLKSTPNRAERQKNRSKAADLWPKIQQQITRQAWGEVWTRPGIDPKTRRFMAMSIMIALHAWDEFRLHVRSGLNQGDRCRRPSSDRR
jgi:alkylhydroperoxidase/carboxymuconolactone decarboxylase family protein YurZ